MKLPDVLTLDGLKREDVRIVPDDVRDILADTITQYEAQAGKTLQPAHIERLIINTWAYREALVRQQFNEAYRQNHPRFATGLALDLCGDMMATPRLAAQSARCTVRFETTGDPTVAPLAPVYIPQGTELLCGSLVWETDAACEIPVGSQTADVIAVCKTTGDVGNGWVAGQITTQLTDSRLGIVIRGKNLTTSSGGIERETDDEYRWRVLLAPEHFATTGTLGAYEYHTRAVSQAITDVWIDNERDNNGQPIGGTVVITILTRDGLPSAELVQQTQAYLRDEKRRPLGDKITVVEPVQFLFEIDAQLTILRRYQAQKATILANAESALNAYLNEQQNYLGRDIVPLDIQRVLQVAGVYNVELITPTLTVVPPNGWAVCSSHRVQIVGVVDG